MIVTCEQCAARYKLDPARITGRGVRITCPSCRHVFVVYRQSDEAGAEAAPAPVAPTPAAPAPAPAPAAAAPSAPTPAPFRATVIPPPSPSVAPMASSAPIASPAPAASTAPMASGPRGASNTAAAVKPAAPKLDLDTLDFTSVGIQAWKVKVRIGLVYDFSDYKTLARYIKDGRVGNDDQISHDGKNWTRLGDIADLQKHFIQVYADARQRQEDAANEDSGRFDDDGPTRIVGVESVTKGLGDLARGRGQAEPDALAEAAAAAAEAEAESAGGRGPRFQDPFEKGRAKREAAPKRAPAAAPRNDTAASARRTGPSMAVMIGIGLLLGGVGAGGWFLYQNRVPEQVGETAAQKEMREAALRADAEKAKVDLREKAKADLAQGLEPTDINPMVTESPEDVRIPVGPGTVRNTSAGNAAGGDGTTRPSKGPETVEVGAATPADHYDAGRSALNAANYSGAVQGFRLAVGGAPNNAEYRYYLGYALDRTGSSEAIGELNQAARLGSKQAYKLLGDISGRQGDVSGAIGYYQQYLATGPSDAAAVQAEIDRLTQ